MLKVKLIYLELLGFSGIENSAFLVESLLCLSNAFFL